MTPHQRMRLYIHIGTHKTGSSSLQHWLGSIRNQLKSLGFSYFEGWFERDNHVELFAIPMRPGREAFARTKHGITGSDTELTCAAARFRNFVARNAGQSLIVSCEGLSLLRFDDELARFRLIVDAGEHEPIIILVLRNKADFLDSFRRQILKHSDRELSYNPTSISYVEPDSWLADYDAIKAIWAKHFPDAKLRVVDYDRSVTAEGDVLPAVLRAMDLPQTVIPEPGQVRVNADGWRQRLRRVLRRFGIRN